MCNPMESRAKVEEHDDIRAMDRVVEVALEDTPRQGQPDDGRQFAALT